MILSASLWSLALPETWCSGQKAYPQASLAFALFALRLEDFELAASNVEHWSPNLQLSEPASEKFFDYPKTESLDLLLHGS